MALIQQNSAYVRQFLMVRSSDHVTGATGANPSVTLSKGGAAFAAAAGAVVEIANGFYKVSYTAADTNTLGDLAAHVTGTGADPTDWIDQIVAFNPNASDLGRAGPGALAYVWTEYRADGVTPLQGTSVWITTDAAGLNTIAGALTTDVTGKVTFELTAGTYYLWRSQAGWTFSNPVTIVVG